MVARHGPGTPLTLPQTRDGRPILSRMDLEHYDARPRRSGGRERYFCPIHGSDHQRSLSVDPATGKYVCHTCKASGTLVEHWPEKTPGLRPRRARPQTAEEIGRRELAYRLRQDAERAEHLAGPLPGPAAGFLVHLSAMQAALRDPSCPGAAYLRGRGLDPALAAQLGAGYAAPNIWPGDRGRRVGRIVYPLADPETGRIVSALGRLCVDAAPSWSQEQRSAFKRVKQRKLSGCPVGVWPYAAIASAREHSRPLVIVEGPADVVALRQHPDWHGDVLTLGGTANVLTAAAVHGIPGVVPALDEDAGGLQGLRSLWVDLALIGVQVRSLPTGWVAGGGATDPADLAARDANDAAFRAAGWYGQAVGAVRGACSWLEDESRRRTPWDEDAAQDLIAAMYERCSSLCGSLPRPWPTLPDECETAIDRAWDRHDRVGLEAAVEACEQQFCLLLSSKQARQSRSSDGAATVADVLESA